MDGLRVNVVLDTSALDDLRTALVESPRRFYQVVNDHIIPQAQARIDALLNKPGEPTGGHYHFSTPKSQRWYFANRKPPYQRTGNVQQWRIILKAFSGQTVEMTFENPVQYAKYVYGSPTQPQVIGHRGHWINADTVLPELVEEVLANLATAWIEQLDESEAA